MDIDILGMKILLERKKIILTIASLAVLIVGTAVFYFNKNHINKPDLTIEQKNRLESYIKGLEGKVAAGDRFAILDTAEYLRELGREDEALSILSKFKPEWKESFDFLVLEARIWAQKKPAEGIIRYEALIIKYPKQESLYQEYINFLKRTEQPQEKIVEYYQKAINNIPNTFLAKDYDNYLKDQNLQVTK